MRQEAIRVKKLGFTGKGSVHPKQIPILNEVFTPSKQSIEKAKRIIKTFQEADTGLVVVDGKLIEKPVLERCTELCVLLTRFLIVNRLQFYAIDLTTVIKGRL